MDTFLTTIHQKVITTDLFDDKTMPIVRQHRIGEIQAFVSRKLGIVESELRCVTGAVVYICPCISVKFIFQYLNMIPIRCGRV